MLVILALEPSFIVAALGVIVPVDDVVLDAGNVIHTNVSQVANVPLDIVTCATPVVIAAGYVIV